MKSKIQLKMMSKFDKEINENWEEGRKALNPRTCQVRR